MAVSPFDSAIYRDLFHDAEVGKLFTDSAEIRAMVLVEGALALAQGELGLIPAQSADFIHRASLEIQIDPAGLSEETGQSAVVVPALVKAFRKLMDAPEHAQYVHWGATSQDIIDTALMLRLRQVLSLLDARLVGVIRALGALAGAHADLPMAARTWGQNATPTSFGAVVTSWGAPLLTHRLRLQELRPRLLRLSFSGAAGTLSVIGDKAPALRAALARALKLEESTHSWHSCRDGIAEFSGWMTLLTGSLGKMGEDLLLLTQSGIDEVTLALGGGSSTMPQKSNPVLPSLLVALARQVAALNAALQGAMLHRQQRDGAAWMVEWMSLGQVCMASARALSAADTVAGTVIPDPIAMARHLDDGSGLIYAEALSFALGSNMPRPEAQAAVKDLCQTVKATGSSLRELAEARWPDIEFGPIFAATEQMGQAPQEARDFARMSKLI